jgi:hypothetical protein
MTISNSTPTAHSTDLSPSRNLATGPDADKDNPIRARDRSAEFKGQIEVARHVMRKRRAVLKELAK